MREASLYTRRADEPGVVDCFLCAHRCRIADGRRGVCGVRENGGGTLYSLNYGRLVARAVDPIEKKPLYHYLPGTRSFSIATVGCNFRCDFCQNWRISQERPEAGDFPGELVAPEEVVADAERNRCASIACTYTEPTIFLEFARDCALIARERGIANVFVTNGYQTPETVEAMTGVIDAANVDLKSFSDDFYRQRCKARLEPVLEAIRLMHAAGIFLELTTLVIPGHNDSEDELSRLAEFIASVSPDVPWHVSRFHPDFKLTDAELTPMRSIERAVAAGERAGLRYVYVGNVATGREGTRCPKCGTEVIARSGFAARVTGLETGEGGRARCSACGTALPIVLRFNREQKPQS